MLEARLLKVFEAKGLVPQQWASEALGNCFAFNPSIVSVKDGKFLLAYRICTTQAEFRKIAVCQLDYRFEIIENSVIALSDLIQFGKLKACYSLNDRSFNWHADPRIFRLKGSLYILWNDGANRPFNNQFMMKISDEGVPLEPAKLVVITNKSRRPVEKIGCFSKQMVRFT